MARFYRSEVLSTQALMEKFQDIQISLTEMLDSYKKRYVRLLQEGGSSEELQSCQRSIQFYLSQIISRKPSVTRHHIGFYLRSMLTRLTPSFR